MNKSAIEKKIGYVFRDGALLQRAFTHGSADSSPERNYQRLEFLGDSILGYTVAEKLLLLHPKAAEGQLTKMRAYVVSEKRLADAVERLGLADFLIAGDNELKSGIQSHDSIRCDLFESVTGAICLDGGADEAKAFVLRVLADDIAAAKSKIKTADAKSNLNEYSMKHGSRIEYRENVSSKDKQGAEFGFTVYADGKPAGKGSGPSKRAAQTAAAASALVNLKAKT